MDAQQRMCRLRTVLEHLAVERPTVFAVLENWAEREHALIKPGRWYGNPPHR